MQYLVDNIFGFSYNTAFANSRGLVMKRICYYVAITAVAITAVFPITTQAQYLLKASDGTPAVPDDWLLGRGRAHHYHTATAPSPSALLFREPRGEETEVVEQARRLLNNTAAKAMALIDGNEVVWVGYKAPASNNSPLLSMSVGKTVTAMAVGAAMCEGRLLPTTRVSELVPELADTHLGKSTV
ncbi:MAG: beta-lactamase family protein, partial [Alphaproteobacteria bacterium]|nr:beta-lactamase family protein [Alphaproteobacteria bacterium]